MTDLWLSRLARLLALSALLAGGAARAEPAVMPVPYAQLQRSMDAVLDFETLPRRAEPGIALNAPMRSGRAWLGERLRGQARRSDGTHDRLSGAPEPPVSVAAGVPGANLSVAFHRGFGSNALFPLGPAGFPALAARGEGTVAIVFDQDQRGVGLRVHSDYVTPLGQARPQGRITLALYTRQGRLIARHTHPLNTAITALGLVRPDGIPDIAAVTVTNDDPGGIALDDILYQTAPVAF